MSANTKLCAPPCDCGSGETRYPLYDGYNIFLCYACDICKEQKLGRYRPDIMEKYLCDEPIEEDDGVDDDVARFPLYPWEK